MTQETAIINDLNKDTK